MIKHVGELHPIEKTDIPFDTVHIGPFNTSTQKNIYLIVLVDGFSKYALLKSSPPTKVDHILRFLEELIKIFGVPKINL